MNPYPVCCYTTLSSTTTKSSATQPPTNATKLLMPTVTFWCQPLHSDANHYILMPAPVTPAAPVAPAKDPLPPFASWIPSHCSAAFCSISSLSMSISPPAAILSSLSAYLQDFFSTEFRLFLLSEYQQDFTVEIPLFPSVYLQDFPAEFRLFSSFTAGCFASWCCLCFLCHFPLFPSAYPS